VKCAGVLAVLTVFAASLFVAGAFGQDPPAQTPALATSYAGFEGRTISKIEIAMAPGGDEDSIRSLLEFKSGDPFSMDKLRESVAAIQKNANFKQVQASLEPEAKGLKVVLLLQPVFHVGLISFPGAADKFNYTILLQTSQIQLDAVYSPDYLPQRAAGLQAFFVKEGYFEANVTSRTKPDPTHRLVNILFDCHLGPRAKVGQVLIEGVSAEEGGKLQQRLKSIPARLNSASVRTGQGYSRRRIEKGLDQLRDYYRKSGRLAPTLRFEPSYDPDTNKADLHIRVTPGPLLEVKLDGAHIWKRTLRKLVPIYEEGAADQDLINEGVRNLRSYFQSKSYFDADVTAYTAKEDDRVTVTYQVDLGKRQRVEHVLFTHNKYFSDPELQSKISINKGKFFVIRGKYSDALMKQSTNSLLALYRNEGFSSVKIEPNVTKAKGGVDVEFVIAEGPQDKVQKLEIVDSKGEPVPAGSWEKRLQIAPGKPYSAHYVAQDRSQVLAHYLNHGYPNATFESKAAPVTDQGHDFLVTYTVVEGQLVNVQDVILLGPQHSKRDFVYKVGASNIKPGQPLNQGQLFQSESDLYGLGIFDWASVTPADFGQGSNLEPVLIRVHESKLNSLDLGGGLEVIPRDGNIPVGAVALPGIPPVSLGNKFTVSQKSFIGPRGSLQYARHDIRGHAETAAIGFVLSRLDQRGAFTYADPHLHSSRWSSLFSVTAEHSTENPIFAAATGQASFQVERQLDKKKTQRLIARYTYQFTDLTKILIPDLVLPQDQRVRLSSPSIQYLRDTRDKPIDAHRGQFQSVTWDISPKSWGSSESFTRAFLQSSYYKPITSKLVWANNFRVGLAAAFSNSDVPLSERYFTGGPDSLRGFPINGAGPQRPVQVCSNPSDSSTCTIISVPTGGDMLAVVNSELRFPIPLYKDLGGAFFYDGGNVYANINARQFLDNYTNSIGIGLRYYTKVGPIRIDLGRNLNPIPGVKATQYFITLGQSF
jgi:outer membrane protein insertion porin family